MARAFLFVLDSFGVGGAEDAERFGDLGSNTFGHIAEACAAGKGDRDGLRSGPLNVPNMVSLGLAKAAETATGFRIRQRPCRFAPLLPARRGAGGIERQGHAFRALGDRCGSGAFRMGLLPSHGSHIPAPSLTQAIISEGNVPGILGDCHASGTEIIERLGEEHIRSGKPICYTSADSVIQIAAHEKHFGLERLYDLCKIVRRLVDPLNIGRVIARPFVGENAATYVRTANRRDYAVPPPEPTLLDRLTARGKSVIGIGKIGDIFAHRGVSEVRKASSNMALLDTALGAMDDAGEGDLVFANFVDFDTLYGHRRDIPGYAAALEAFDRRLPEVLARLRSGDLLILTADHGCDPSWRGTDHTRERVPVFGLAKGLRGGDIGLRLSYADIGESVAAHLGLPRGRHGQSFHATIAANA